jgi:hypothetical protein
LQEAVKKKQKKRKGASFALSSFKNLSAALSDVAADNKQSPEAKKINQNAPRFRTSAAREQLLCATAAILPPVMYCGLLAAVLGITQ